VSGDRDDRRNAQRGPEIDLRSLLVRPIHREHQGVVTTLTDDRDDYCANFGDQWNRFGQIQLDSRSGSRESHDRFFRETGWSAEELKGKVLLDAGCGAGRFAEVALEAGASVVAVDISQAAYACRRNLDRFPADRYLVVRASILDLPLAPGSFDGVYSLGVLQHTPDPLGALGHLAGFVRPGGRLAAWVYEKRSSVLEAFLPRVWIRRLTRSWSDPAKLRLARILTTAFFPVGWALSWLGRPGQLASWLLPYAARHEHGRGDLGRQWRYGVMDTFDWYGPTYETRQNQAAMTEVLRQAGLIDVRRLPVPGLAMVADRPAAPR
jgi:SAM-dependent methyltransferase